jgi:hypothetical protein
MTEVILAFIAGFLCGGALLSVAWDRNVAKLHKAIVSLQAEKASAQNAMFYARQEVQRLKPYLEEAKRAWAERDAAIAERDAASASIAPFDHDHDGKPGGSVKKGRMLL